MRNKVAVNSLKHSRGTRNETADLLKGLAVVFMIMVHVTELFFTEELFQSSIGKLFLFLGGTPAAPVFMATMGFFIAGSKSNLEKSIIRGLSIIILGFFLNISLNLNLFIKIYSGVFPIDPLKYLFGVDILHLAGLSIIIMALIKRLLNIHYTIPLLISILICILSKFLVNIPIENYKLLFLLSYFWGASDWSYFPIIPWISYPMLGYAFYLFVKNNSQFLIKKSFIITLMILWVLYLSFSIDFAVYITSDLLAYYHHSIEFYVWSIVFLSGYIYIMHLINQVFSKYKALIFIKWLGVNVTTIYFIQWTIIGNLSTEIYKTQNLLNSTLLFFLIIAITVFFTILYNKLKEIKK